MGRAARTDDSDRVMIAFLEFTPNVEHDRWSMNFAQRFRVGQRLLCNHGRAEFADSLQFCGKIDNRFPT